MLIPAPVVIEYDDAHFWNFEEANVVFASPEAVNPAELVDLLDNACFSSSDDREADSWDTQHDRFLLDAQEMATRRLRSEEHTSELQSLLRTSYAVFCLQKKK